MYTEDQRNHIQVLYNVIADSMTPIAVVDYVGQVRWLENGERRIITEEDTPSNRFGIEDMPNAISGGLKVVRVNEAATAF